MLKWRCQRARGALRIRARCVRRNDRREASRRGARASIGTIVSMGTTSLPLAPSAHTVWWVRHRGRRVGRASRAESPPAARYIHVEWQARVAGLQLNRAPPSIHGPRLRQACPHVLRVRQFFRQLVMALNLLVVLLPLATQAPPPPNVLPSWVAPCTRQRTPARPRLLHVSATDLSKA